MKKIVLLLTISLTISAINSIDSSDLVRQRAQYLRTKLNDILSLVQQIREIYLNIKNNLYSKFSNSNPDIMLQIFNILLQCDNNLKQPLFQLITVDLDNKAKIENLKNKLLALTNQQAELNTHVQNMNNIKDDASYKKFKSSFESSSTKSSMLKGAVGLLDEGLATFVPGGGLIANVIDTFANKAINKTENQIINQPINPYDVNSTDGAPNAFSQGSNPLQTESIEDIVMLEKTDQNQIQQLSLITNSFNLLFQGLNKLQIDTQFINIYYQQIMQLNAQMQQIFTQANQMFIVLQQSISTQQQINQSNFQMILNKMNDLEQKMSVAQPNNANPSYSNPPNYGPNNANPSYYNPSYGPNNTTSNAFNNSVTSANINNTVSTSSFSAPSFNMPYSGL